MHHVGEPHSYPKWEEADWAAVEDSLFDDGQDITGTADAFVSQKGDILLVWQEDGNPLKLWGNTYRFSSADEQDWTAAEAAAGRTEYTSDAERSTARIFCFMVCLLNR